MKRIVWKFGLIAGAVLSAAMAVTMVFVDRIGMDGSEVLGYTTMVAAFLMVYFGVRRYRDEVLGGVIGFGRAFAAGLLITAIASACYVATWEVIYYKVTPDFAEKYAAHVLAKAQASGASAQALEEKRREMVRFREMYRNPFFNVAMTFVEPLPVGLLVALVSAGVLSRRKRATGAGDGTASPVMV